MEIEKPDKQRQQDTIELKGTAEYKGFKGGFGGRLIGVPDKKVTLVLLFLTIIIDLLFVGLFIYLCMNDVPSFGYTIVYFVLGLLASAFACGVFIWGASKLIMLGEKLR